MHYKNTIELIYANLAELQNQVATFGTDNKLHQIDIDLALSKLRNTYDLLLNLRTEIPDNETLETKELLESSIEFAGEPLEIEEPSLEVNRPEVEKNVSDEQVSAQEIAKNIKQEFADESREVLSSDRTAVGKAGEVIGENLASDKPSLNEELSKNSESEDLTAKLNTKPISSITSAIGLNEKFELINNLFEGDADKYNHVMHILNMATNFNEAYNYLKESFNWDMDSPYVQRVLELIRRKLIVRKNDE